MEHDAMKQLMKSLIVALAIVVALPVFAAGQGTLTFDESKAQVSTGDVFDLNVRVAPNGEPLDTVRAIITFDPNVLSATDASLIGAFNRVAPGNGINNTAGWVSLGGFTLDGPITSSGAFARVSFRAKAQGETTVAISPDSKMISEGEEKIDSKSLGSVQVTIGLPSVNEGVATLSVISTTHLNDVDWYPLRDATMSWSVTEGSAAITGFYTAIDQSPDTDPKTYEPATVTEATFQDLAYGTWYFHLKGVQRDGKETQTVHRRILVDKTPPNAIAPSMSIDQSIEGETTELIFGTTDETSGVVSYEVAVNNGPYIPKVSPVTISEFTPGTYLFQVGAVVGAGNKIFGTTTLRIYPKGTELKRPEGFTPTSASDALKKWNVKSMLITLSLTILIILGIILAIVKKKRHNII